MKKFALYLTFSFLLGSSFHSCKDADRELSEEVENDIIEIEEETEAISENFNDFDLNKDKQWDPREFEASKTVDYIVWDSDNDGNLDKDEFYRSTFAVVDTNKDKILSKTEWDSGSKGVYQTHFSEEDFEFFDEDEDGLLDNEEWIEGLKDSDWFSNYDTDKNIQLNDTEWRSGLFNDLDVDNDGFLNENEYTVMN